MNLGFGRWAFSWGFVAFLVFGLAALPALGENWVQFVRSQDSTETEYYDANSVRMERNLRYVWTKRTYAEPQYNVTAQGYVSSLYNYIVIDCSSRTMADIEIIYRDVNQKTLYSVSVQVSDLKFYACPPNSLGASLVSTVCSLGTRREQTPRGNRGQTEAKNASTVGSGFVVSFDGLVVTNAHVVPRCEAMRVTTSSGERRTASLAAIDPQSDLALLRTKGSFSSVAGFRVGRPVRLGEDVIALGYPLHGLLASGVNVSSGTVSALAGIANDSTKLQISAPVQPGNSGGPLLDLSGAVVGIVVAKLDAIKMAAAIGDIPQNVNFAIKADVARLFLEGQGVSLQLAQPSAPRKKEDVAAMGRDFTVLVECLNGSDAK